MAYVTNSQSVDTSFGSSLTINPGHQILSIWNSTVRLPDTFYLLPHMVCPHKVNFIHVSIMHHCCVVVINSLSVDWD